LSFAAGALATVASLASPSFGGIVKFGGTGVGQSFNMEFVRIGNAGNVADTTGTPNPAGKVNYEYNIGKFEVSRADVNAYNANPGVVAITTDTILFPGVNKPATGITWNEAARFVNWLNTSTGSAAAYNFVNNNVTTNITPWTPADTADYDPSNPYRSRRTRFALPSFNEFYKAAFYDPSKSGGAGYWNYATRSDSAPTSTTGGTTAGTAVFGLSNVQGPADVTQAGGLSAYGVMGLGGNAREWEESSFDLTNSSGSANRGVRFGNWNDTASFLSSSAREFAGPNFTTNGYGFRVVELPEPTSMAIFGLGALGMAYRARRKRDA
jgi:formylglycine-generating enzyme required for sulfatase activity